MQIRQKKTFSKYVSYSIGAGLNFRLNYAYLALIFECQYYFYRHLQKYVAYMVLF